jgi:hypothetical protein
MVRIMSGNATRRVPANGGETLDCDAAARTLAVQPDVLLSWAERLSFPEDIGEPGTPRFRRAEIEALKVTLSQAHSVEGAVRAAQALLGGGGSTSP